MYKIIVTSSGKYNTTLGTRYILLKKDVLELVAILVNSECNFQVYKFMRLHDTVFAWTDEYCKSINELGKRGNKNGENKKI